MNCKKCGKPIKDGAAFCGNCGEPFSLSETIIVQNSNLVPTETFHVNKVNSLSERKPDNQTIHSIYWVTRTLRYTGRLYLLKSNATTRGWLVGYSSYCSLG